MMMLRNEPCNDQAMVDANCFLGASRVIQPHVPYRSLANSISPSSSPTVTRTNKTHDHNALRIDQFQKDVVAIIDDKNRLKPKAKMEKKSLKVDTNCCSIIPLVLITDMYITHLYPYMY